eukprot:SAG11_NODE_7358_length_1156_cov_1.461684_1_plen_85_part_00
MQESEETIVTIEALACVHATHRETLGLRALSDGAEGAPRFLTVEGAMPSQQTSREVRARGCEQEAHWRGQGSAFTALIFLAMSC